MPQHRSGVTGTARIRRTTVPGAFEGLYQRTLEIRQRMADTQENVPTPMRPAPPTPDSFNRPMREGVRADFDRRGRRKPYLGGARTPADSTAAYQGMYHTSPELGEAIASAARKHQIPLEIAFGLVDTESSFRQNRRSGVGAVGLTQVRPEFAGKEVGADAGELATDPIANLDAGFAYLSKQYDRFQDWNKALDAYNRGPTAHQRAPRRGYARKVQGE